MKNYFSRTALAIFFYTALLGTVRTSASGQIAQLSQMQPSQRIWPATDLAESTCSAGSGAAPAGDVIARHRLGSVSNGGTGTGSNLRKTSRSA